MSNNSNTHELMAMVFVLMFAISVATLSNRLSDIRQAIIDTQSCELQE